MKVTRIIIHNIGLIADTTIECNLPLLIFYGQVCAGKTTILNAVRWACGGEYPADIMRHGSVEAFVELVFDGSSIKREWYIGRDQTTKARSIKFIKDGRLIDQPTTAIKLFLNPFLLDQDYLRNMNEMDRKRFFVEQFGVDTKALDEEQLKLEREAQTLRAEIKAYGVIDVTPVEVPDVSVLKQRRKEGLDAYHTQVTSLEAINRATLDENAQWDRRFAEAAQARDEIKVLKEKLFDIERQLIRAEVWMVAHPKEDPLPIPAAPDMTPYDTRINSAAADQVRFEQYQKNLERSKEQVLKTAELKKRETRQLEIQREKVAQLKGLSDTCGVPGLAFNEAGDFTYESTTAGMLSTSQLMKLSSAVAELYPEGFGLNLLDRGESLGRHIFEYVDRAREKNTTILATVVGERPAKVPSGVGVFVVTDGIVLKDEEAS